MNNYYIVTEAFYHTSFLVNSAIELIEQSKKYDKVILVIRNKLKLTKETLDFVHDSSNFSDKESQISAIYQTYGTISAAEQALLEYHDIPKRHCLSGANTVQFEDLNSLEVQSMVRSDVSNKCAGIFLDCILQPWWITVFSGKVINAHTAILPYVKGMYAIEQYILSCSTVESFENSAGATLHYIDNGVDTGAIIKTKLLPDIWSCNSISHVKAESYLQAFGLLIQYSFSENAFCLNDAKPQEFGGQEFFAKNYTSEKCELSNSKYLQFKYQKMESMNG